MQTFFALSLDIFFTEIRWSQCDAWWCMGEWYCLIYFSFQKNCLHFLRGGDGIYARNSIARQDASINVNSHRKFMFNWTITALKPRRVAFEIDSITIYLRNKFLSGRKHKRQCQYCGRPKNRVTLCIHGASSPTIAHKACAKWRANKQHAWRNLLTLVPISASLRGSDFDDVVLALWRKVKAKIV